MAFTADQFGMSVVVPGGMAVNESSYLGDGSTTFAKGDLIRVTTSGQIKDAAADSSTKTGPAHGLILNDWTTAPTTSQYVAILEFASDTEIESQGYAATAADSEPQDFTVGASYTVRNGSAGIWSVTTTTSNGYAQITKIPGGKNKYFIDDYAVDQDYGIINFAITEANLRGHDS